MSSFFSSRFCFVLLCMYYIGPYIFFFFLFLRFFSRVLLLLFFFYVSLSILFLVHALSPLHSCALLQTSFRECVCVILRVPKENICNSIQLHLRRFSRFSFIHSFILSITLKFSLVSRLFGFITYEHNQTHPHIRAHSLTLVFKLKVMYAYVYIVCWLLTITHKYLTHTVSCCSPPLSRRHRSIHSQMKHHVSLRRRDKIPLIHFCVIQIKFSGYTYGPF